MLTKMVYYLAFALSAFIAVVIVIEWIDLVNDYMFNRKLF